MKQVSYILFLVLIFSAGNVQAQFDGVARLEEGSIIYTLDLRWNEAQRKEVVSTFELDSTVWEKLVTGGKEILLDSTFWAVKKISDQVIEISKKLDKKHPVHLSEFDIFLDNEKWKVPPGYVDQEKVIYGFNNFNKSNIFGYRDGIVQFFLPGFEKSKKIFIAGNFNNWAPNKTAMQRVDSGWVVKLSLPPGKYFYKYVVDGRWTTDPSNRFDENDGQGNINSVVYVPNFQFKLNNYTKAKKVVVAGTFNNWNRTELNMHRSPEGWILPMYLKDGTYSYKFLVDNEWITDPNNQLVRKDNQGNQNSVVSKGDEHIFALKGFENAQMVMLAGNFNNWNPGELPMDKVTDGWQIPYRFSPGNYEYKFIVDGRWITDPANPYKIGSGRYENSCLAYKANHTFVFRGSENIRNVIVTGTFINWNPDGYRMIKKDGVWTFPVYLNKGKHLYKFIVDGKWILDPANKLWEQNEHGTGNSILWID